MHACKSILHIVTGSYLTGMVKCNGIRDGVRHSSEMSRVQSYGNLLKLSDFANSLEAMTGDPIER